MATFPIVTVNASVIQAPMPNNIQQRGAFVTQGGTTTAADTLTLCSTLAAVVALVPAVVNIASITWTSNVVTVTTSTPHGWASSDVVKVVIAGVLPAGYNGTFTATITGTETLTYPLTSNPGMETQLGTVGLLAGVELVQMATTYFAGNGVPAIYVLELGEGDPSVGPAELVTFINDVAGTALQMYAYLIPREWDDVSQFLSILENYTSPNALLYFYVTTILANIAVYAPYKCVLTEVEAPSTPATEFSLASAFGTALKASPSSTNKVPPLSYAPSYGTTAYPARGNQTTFQDLADANVGWIGTGAQGGVAGNILFEGKMSDGNSWNYWYSVDWAQVNMNLAIANEVILGSATSLNPLYYNQQGINRLQNRAVQTATQGVAAGLAEGQVVATKLPVQTFLDNYNSGMYVNQIVINAEPFVSYTTENPGDYGIGKYAGLACIWIPQENFLNIFFSLQATTLISGG